MRPPGPVPPRAGKIHAFFRRDLFGERRSFHARRRALPERRGWRGTAARWLRSASAGAIVSALAAGAFGLSGIGAPSAGGCFTFLQKQRDLSADRRFPARGDEVLVQDAVVEGLHLHRRLVRLDLGEHVAGLRPCRLRSCAT